MALFGLTNRQWLYVAVFVALVLFLPLSVLGVLMIFSALLYRPLSMPWKLGLLLVGIVFILVGTVLVFVVFTGF